MPAPIPDFFAIVGAQRCGTTWLYSMLDQHPEIEMAKPMRPEPKFFLDKNFVERGKYFYLNKYFPHCDNSVIGEKSTSYLEVPAVGEAIKKLFPHAKILIVLRNPVERALSNYFFSVNHGLETRSIEDVFIHNAPAPDLDRVISVNPFDYLQRGLYHQYIEAYSKVFPAKSIKVVTYESITCNPDELSGLYKFLCVDGSFVPSGFGQVLNRSVEEKLVPASIRQKLAEYYRDNNSKLLSYADISCWGGHV